MVEAKIENAADDTPGLELRLAYFTNEYPAPSHTFIRREIAAIEALGVPVTRFAVRPSPAPLVAEADIEESLKTSCLLDFGVIDLLGHTLVAAMRSPLRFFSALRAALHLSRGANRGLLTHLAYVAQACVLWSWTRRARITHLHVHFASNPAGIALLCERLGGLRWSLTVHGPEEFEDPGGFRLREKIAGAAFVAGVSEFTAAALRGVAWPQDSPKIHVVRCGVSSTFLAATPTPVPQALELLCVGRLSERKRQVLLVQAFARVITRGVDAHLTLIGDGPTRGEVEREIAAHGLQDRVRLAGWRDEQGVRDAIAAARVLVLPSSSEGLPVAIMEAFALARPVIATSVAGIPELVEPGVNGWLVAVDDLDALAGAIADAMTLSPARLAEMGEAGRRSVIEWHDVRRSAARLIELMATGVLSDVG